MKVTLIWNNTYRDCQKYSNTIGFLEPLNIFLILEHRSKVLITVFASCQMILVLVLTSNSSNAKGSWKK